MLPQEMMENARSKISTHCTADPQTSFDCVCMITSETTDVLSEEITLDPPLTMIVHNR